jgi:hypothetical protein
VAKGKKRELKAKAVPSEIILKGRSNRDEDMKYFATYYTQNFKGFSFVGLGHI